MAENVPMIGEKMKPRERFRKTMSMLRNVRSEIQFNRTASIYGFSSGLDSDSLKLSFRFRHPLRHDITSSALA
jgi:hypothetical protein